ncbi:MAG: helix-turn-helix domain-containing protein [Treponema sp.]|nr:helix-turn-helix domain-containing protein [Treponema sp.]
MLPICPSQSGEEIPIALEQGQSLRSIAESLGRSPSSISREIQRNSPPVNKVKYRRNRARRSHPKKRLATPCSKLAWNTI